MSRGFVKEDDQEEAPFIPSRAPLPDGVLNYVTSRGMELLLNEREALERERSTVIEEADADDRDRRRDLIVINGKLDLLNERIATAQLVDHSDSPAEEIRFGSSVIIAHLDGPPKGNERSLTIVGVDEADVKLGKIAFTAPIAKALIGKKRHEIASLRLGAIVQRLKILSIS